MNHDQIKHIVKSLKDGDVVEIKYNATVLKNATDSVKVEFADGATAFLYISEMAASDAEVSVISRAIPKEPNSLDYNLHGKHLLILDRLGVAWRKGVDGWWQSFETGDIFEWEDLYKKWGPVTIYTPNQDV